jgi:hypothetical protein
MAEVKLLAGTQLGRPPRFVPIHRAQQIHRFETFVDRGAQHLRREGHPGGEVCVRLVKSDFEEESFAADRHDERSCNNIAVDLGKVEAEPVPLGRFPGEPAVELVSCSLASYCRALAPLPSGSLDTQERVQIPFELGSARTCPEAPPQRSPTAGDSCVPAVAHCG